TQPRLDPLLWHLRRAAGAHGDLTDRQLLDRFSSCQDEAAFCALLDRHGAMVLGVCRRVLRQEQDAEDAFQATFLVLACKAASIRHGRAVGSWLYEVAFHVALRARTRAARRRACEQQAEPSQAAPRDDLEARDLRPVLDEELNRLPAAYRRPLVMCYLEG